MTTEPSAPPGPAYPRPSGIMIVRWLCRIGVAFMVACAGLIAGFAPYTAQMAEILQVSGLLLLGAGACALTDNILGRRGADPGR